MGNDGPDKSRDRATRIAEFADLLRARRERLQPHDVGLPAGVRRRTPGLRREEVAQLATISTTYYTHLEQGRDVRPSRQVLDALAGALRLRPAERTHMHDLVHGDPAGTPVDAEVLAPAVIDLVDRLDPSPAYVTGRRFDVLAANRAARLLWTDFRRLRPADRNLVWWMFTDPSARTKLVDWEDEAAALLARFRAAADRHADDPSFVSLVDRLRHASPEARDLWSRHDDVALGSGTKRLRHSVLGVLELSVVVLQLADDLAKKVVTFGPRPADLDRLAALLTDD